MMTRRRIITTLIVLATISVALLNYKERDSYRCRTCRSSKHVFQWRLGSWGGASIPITPKWQRIEESNLYRDFFPADHVHDWQYAQGSPYYLFGTSWGGCAIGGGRHTSELFQLYESSAAFRTLLQTRLREGALSRTAAVELLSMPSSPESADAPLHAIYQSLLDDYLKKNRNASPCAATSCAAVAELGAVRAICAMNMFQ